MKRKLIEFAPEIWLALEMLAKDTGRSVQDLADEAFGDLLGKYQRPASLKDALRESAVDTESGNRCLMERRVGGPSSDTLATVWWR